jgi:hypothetical protein
LNVAREREVVADAIDVAGPVDEQRKDEDAHDDQSNRPAKD